MKTSDKTVPFILAAWLVLAVAVGISGLLSHAAPPQPQVLVVVLTFAVLSPTLRVPRLREWADAVSIRVFVSIHLSRFIGIYFLFLSSRGTLAPAFAIPAGWGDILVATTAVALLMTSRAESHLGRRLYFAWNILGALDILFVVVTAARVGLADPVSIKALLHLPLSLLPTFLVPLIIATHMLLFRRLRMSQLESVVPVH